MVISTGYGGVHEYMTDGQDSILIPYKLQPLRGMSHATHFYSSDQRWAEIDTADLSKAMYDAWQMPTDSLKDIARSGQALVTSTFSFESVGHAMKQRLEAIEATL
jgi:hypothetical protein